tara:strand:- start:6388 stop:7029 length:642 start_codon:yes stop_codon:yes gene_type:complete
MGKIGEKFKKVARVGAKVAVVGGALLGAGLGIKSEYDGVKADQRAELSNFLDPRNQPNIKPQGAGTEVIGTDSEGNIFGGAKVGTAGPGVKLGKPAPQAQQLPSPLDPSKLQPFKQKVGQAAGQAAIGQVAGVVSGQQGVGGAVKEIAGAVFGAAQKPKDPIAQKLSKAGRDAQAGSTVVAGAEGIQASNKELLGQLAGKLKPKKLLKKKKKK